MKKKMKKNSVSLAIIGVLLIAMFASIQLSLPANAKVEEIGAPQLAPWPTAVPQGVTPNVTIATTAFISISPNPIGVGQSVLINLWLEPPVQYNRYFSGYTVTV